MRSLAVQMCCVVGGLLGLFWILHSGSAVRAGTSPSSTVSGDVNGDGQLDISDAVYTLSHLFNGGPAPVACAQPAAIAERVEALEDAVARLRHEADCSPERRRPERFVDNGNGTLMDPCSGLTWAQRPADLNHDGGIDANDKVAWDEAAQLVSSLHVADADGWRLPTAAELDSLPSCSSCGAGAIWVPRTPFRDIDAGPVWSSESYADDQAWLFSPSSDTGPVPFPRSYRALVLAVRGP